MFKHTGSGITWASTSTRHFLNMGTHQMVNTEIAERSLKGLLMDKGAQGYEEKIHNVLRKMLMVQDAMEKLMMQQRASREAAGSECIELYLATSLRVSKGEEAAAGIRELPVSRLSYEHTKRPMVLEWRARREFALRHGHANTARISAFNPSHEHYRQVRNFVDRQTPQYYEVLAGYDVVRVTLNNTLKSLRKTILDLNNLVDETAYPDDVSKDAEKMSKRIFRQLPNSDELSTIFTQLYYC